MWKRAAPKEVAKGRESSTAVERPKATTQAEGSELEGLQYSAGNQAVSAMLQSAAEDPSSEIASAGIRSPGKSLDAATRDRMESQLGQDLSDVRLHTDAEAARSAALLGARAYTVGDDVVLGGEAGESKSAPHQRLLAHELAHVVQQRDGTWAKPTPNHEMQAEQAASAVMAGQFAPVAPAGVSGVQRRRIEEEETTAAGGEATTATGTASQEGNQSEAGGGFFANLWSGIKSAGDAVWSGIKSAGEAVWGGLKSAGSAIWSALETVGGWLKTAGEAVWTAIKWVGKQLWDKLVGVFARVARWVQKLPERVGRLLTGLWEGLLSLKPWSLEWWKSLGKAETWGNFLKWLGSRVVDLLEIAGVGEIYETAADFIKFNTRTLTGQEEEIASSIFGSSINLKLVRIDEYALLGPSWSDREYTSFHTINGWGRMTDDTLIHELVHVWQYENAGAIYMPQAIHAQVWGEGYDYKGVAGLQKAKDEGKDIRSFNREQQAQIVQDFYRIKQGKQPYIPGGTAADLPLFAYFVKDVSTLSEAQLLA